MKKEQKCYIAKGYQVVPKILAIICLAIMFAFLVGMIVILNVDSVSENFKDIWGTCFGIYVTVAFISIIIIIIESKVINKKILAFKSNAKYEDGIKYLSKVSKNVFLFPHFDICNGAKGIFNVYLDRLDDAVEDFSKLDLTKNFTHPTLQIQALLFLYMIFLSKNESDKQIEIKNLYLKQKKRVQQLLSDKRFASMVKDVQLMDAFLQGNQAEIQKGLSNNLAIPLFNRLLNK